MRSPTPIKSPVLLSLLWLIGFITINLTLTTCSEEWGGPDRSEQIHPTRWMDTSSADFHGRYLAMRGYSQLTSCLTCHTLERDTLSSSRAPACFSCHDGFPHPPGWSGPATENLHASFLARTGWNLAQCQKCHRSDYRRPIPVGSGVGTCFTCHQRGPEDCSVCHGGGQNSAPPPDLQGNTAPETLTVGAHQAHLNPGRYSLGFSCGECHHQPSFFADTLHIDRTTPGIAEVIFGPLASDSGRTSPIWTRNTGTCSSIYCHGAFTGGNQSHRLIWNRVDGSQVYCGSCHGLPPSSPHHQVEDVLCYRCHLYSLNTHINGRVDLRP